MKIVIAPDSYKESLPATEVCQAIKAGFSQVYPEANYTLLPLADGGEGTAAVLSYVLDGEWKEVEVHDPLMRPINAQYYLTHAGMAVIEIAEACGLHLLHPSERNPLLTTTYGVGELLLDALKQGAKQVFIGLGGSATNDAGAGMLQALGVKLYDQSGNELTPGGAQLSEVHTIEAKSLQSLLLDVSITVACDVTSPLCGTSGASHIFGPQKGATAEEVLILDDALSHFAQITDLQSINSEDCSQFEGAGAAGGLGFALMAYCNAQLKSGFETIADIVDLDQQLDHADLVITGEGKLDAQTSIGKVASGVALRAKAKNIPVMAICGSVDLQYHYTDLETSESNSASTSLDKSAFNISPFNVVVPSIQKLDKIEQILAQAYTNVAQTAYQLATTLKLGEDLATKHK